MRAVAPTRLPGADRRLRRWSRPQALWRIAWLRKRVSFQITYEPLYESVFGVRGHAGADLLLRQSHGEFGGITLQSHAGGLAGGRDFLFGVRLYLGDFGPGLLRQALGFRLGLDFALTAQRGDVFLQVGQAAVHVGGFGFGLLPLAERIVHVLADAGRTRREKRTGVLADEVAQQPGEQQEVHPLE